MKVSNEARYDVYTCALWNTIKWYYVFFIKTVYCRGSGFELSAFLSLAVCHDSSVRRVWKFPMSMTFALSKSITWSLSHACFAMFEPLLCFLTFLMCSAFLVLFEMFCLEDRNVAKRHFVLATAETYMVADINKWPSAHVAWRLTCAVWL